MHSIYYLLPFLLFYACKAPDNYSSEAILIKDIHILDVGSGKVISKQNIVIDSGKVIRISEKPLTPARFYTVIDGTNKYIMPGLAEMHAHIPGPNESEERRRDVLFLYLSQGVTTIRGMLGDSIHLGLREKANSGEILSPRIFTSSPSLNGNTVQTREQADSLVRKYKKDGYDFLKIHPGILRPHFDQIVVTADEVGIRFSGHVPVDVGIRHALESKYASIDHIDGFLEGLVPEHVGVNPGENGFFGYNFTPYIDTTLIEELVNLAKENKVWIVPTQSLFERWFAPVSTKELISQVEMKYMPGSTLRNWVRIKNQTMENEGFDSIQWMKFDGIRKKLLKELSINGHGILMGSDAPQLFNVPGFSIHHEIDGMENAGMDNLEIIRSGTINPALFFGMENIFGQVKEGMTADLIITHENPLEDLDALQNIFGVMRMGKWIPDQEIQQKLVQIAERLEGK